MATDRRDWESMRQKGESETGSVFAIHVQVTDPKTGEKRAERRFVAQFRAFDYRGQIVTYKSTKHSTEARAWRSMPALQARAIEGKLPPQKAARERETVAEYLKAWHDRRVKTKAIRPLTAVNEARHVKLIAALELGSRVLRDVTYVDVEQLLRDLEVKLDEKPRARQQVYQVVRTAFRAAPRDTWTTSPLDGIKPPKAPAATTRSFTPDELNRILEAVDRPLPEDTLVDEEFAGLIWFLARTGTRIGEAQALRWSDVDLQIGTARIETSAFEAPKSGVVIGPTKSARPRVVHLAPVLVTRLQALRGRFDPVPLDIGARFVFGALDGAQPFRRSNVHCRRWSVLLDSLEIARCGFHRLRHTFASLSLAAGADVMTLSDALGHATGAFTLARYGHALPDRQAEAATKLDAFLDAVARPSAK